MNKIITIELITSLLVYAASIGYGGAISSLGAGLPELSELLSISESICGQLFAFRGCGYLIGSLLSSRINNNINISKYNIVAYSIYLSGLSTLLCAITTNFMLLKFIILFQGLGFALIDVFGAVCLCELWGDKVQPWIQIRSATCSFGAVIGPLLIGHFGFRIASIIVACLCFMTTIFQIFVFLKSKDEKEHLPLDSERSVSNHNNHDGHGFETNNSDNKNTPSMPPSLYQYSLLHGSGLLTEQQNSHAICPNHNISITKSWYLAFCSSDKLILIILSTIMLIFHGVYYVANGWIPTYSILSEITDSRSKAASLLSAYSSALMTGSSLSAIFSVYIPREWILRIIFTTLGISCFILVIFQNSITYYPLLGCVIIMGFSIGPMYGMILTLPSQLNILMDSNATSSIVFGGCIGESLLPVFVGWCIGQWGSKSFPWSMLLMLLSMVVLYLVASLISSTSHQNFKKPWKGFKLSIRNISISSKQKFTKSNPQEDSNSDEENEEEVREEERDDNYEEGENTELIIREPFEIRI